MHFTDYSERGALDAMARVTRWAGQSLNARKANRDDSEAFVALILRNYTMWWRLREAGGRTRFVF